jgi:hypothetical protein
MVVQLEGLFEGTKIALLFANA